MMEPKIEKIHEDRRGAIYLVRGLLEGDKEFTFLEINTGYARGGCLHSQDEYFTVIKGKIKYIYGNGEEIVHQGESRKIPAGERHAFIGLEYSIVSEWGVSSEDKRKDRKDSKLRELVDRINKK